MPNGFQLEDVALQYHCMYGVRNAGSTEQQFAHLRWGRDKADFRTIRFILMEDETTVLGEVNTTVDGMIHCGNASYRWFILGKVESFKAEGHLPQRIQATWYAIEYDGRKHSGRVKFGREPFFTAWTVI